MLAIPMMKSEPAGSFDVSPFTSYLNGQRCYDNSLLSTDLLRFQSMRVQAASVQDPNDTNVQILTSYIGQLLSMTPRFTPQVMEHEIKQLFSWTDAFVLSKRQAVPSFFFEQAAIAWNIGSLESLRGGRLDRSTDDGVRLAAKHFQTAAVCFDFILTNILPNLNPTILANCPCLSNESLNLSKQLMLAQAQLCFYEKAVRDKKKDMMKSAIIAKLAMQVHVFYAAAASAARGPTLLPFLDGSWGAISEFQSKSFHGASEYWQALASKEAALTKGSGYGEEVARYIRAEQHVRQALEVSKRHNLSPSLQGGAEALLAAISTNRQQSLHELTNIYMEAVPNDQSLSEIPPVAMVKASGLAIQATDDMLFAFVLPRELISMISRFYDDVKRAHNKWSVAVTENTSIARTSLSSLGLPSSLESAKNNEVIPDSLWNKISELQGRNFVPLLSAQFDDIGKSSRRAQQTIQNIEESLSDSERKDDMFRARYPSYLAEKLCRQNDETRKNLQTYKNALQSAQQNDAALRIDLNSPELQNLTRSRNDLANLIQSQTVNLLDLDTSSGTVRTPEMDLLEDKLHELAALLEDREKDVNAIKVLGSKDLSKEFSASFAKGENAQSTYDRYQNELQSKESTLQNNIAQQDIVLSEIVRLNSIFVNQRQADPQIVAKAQLVSDLEKAIAKANALQMQLTSGQTFYSNLQAQLTTLQQNADENAYTAQWQRQEFEASLSVVEKSTPGLSAQFTQSVNLTGNVAAPAAAPAAGAYSSYSAYPSVNNVAPAQTNIYSSPPPQPVQAYNPQPVQSYTSQPQAAQTYNPTPVQPTYTQYATPAHTAVASPPPAPTSTYQYNQSSYSVLPPSSTPAAQTATSPTVTAPTVLPVNFTQYPNPTNTHQVAVGQPTSAPHHVSNPAQPPAPAPAPVHLSQAEMDGKISRLMEMGFPRDSVVKALSGANWQEEMALNTLLAGPDTSGAAAPPPKPPKNGMFSSFWGKK